MLIYFAVFRRVTHVTFFCDARNVTFHTWKLVKQKITDSPLFIDITTYLRLQSIKKLMPTIAHFADFTDFLLSNFFCISCECDARNATYVNHKWFGWRFQIIFNCHYHFYWLGYNSCQKVWTNALPLENSKESKSENWVKTVAHVTWNGPITSFSDCQFRRATHQK